MKQAHILSDSERESIASEKKQLESTLKEVGLYGKGSHAEHIDRDQIQKEISKLDNVLVAGSPKRMKERTKDELAKKSRELETSIREGMPTRNEMEDLKKNAIRKHRDWERRNSKKIHEWKQIQRTLNDNSSNVERLRKNR